MNNVILIVLDSLRRDHVGAYGNDWIDTPNMDTLAAESVLYTNAYPEALPTIPVRRAMYTGMRTFPCRDYKAAKGDVVLIPGWQPIPEHQVTAAEVFRHHGYMTALFSSVHHMFKPSMNFHRGFTSWEWIRGHEADHLKVPYGGDLEDPGNLPCDEMYGMVGHSLPYCLANVQNWRREEDWFAPRSFGAAARWLERNGGDQNFFLVVEEFDPHEPWNPPKEYLDMYFDTDSYDGRRIIPTVGGPNEFMEGELEYTLAMYTGEVTHCDTYVGRLLDRVKEMGLWDDTVVALVSDHGHPIMDHGIMHKLPSHMYNELMDLVYMVKSPAGEHGGETCPAYAAHHDIPVTLMEMAGVTPPTGLDGVNVWDAATGAAEPTRAYATCIFYPWLWTKDNTHVYMTDIDNTEERLYDTTVDPKETNDVAASKPQVCRRLRKRLWDEIGRDPPRYEIIRQGHDWYEYPDIHDPTGTFSKKLIAERDAKKRRT